jgi:type IV fimbrial biogenesis protein FimT
MQERASTARRQRGTSLIEVVTALSVTGVLATASVPSITSVMSSRHAAPTTNELLAALNLARSEAIARGSRVAIAASAGDWSQGWHIFADHNDNGALDADEPVIRQFAPSAPGLTITPHFGATYAGTVLSYDGTGRLVRPGGHGLVLGRLTLTQGIETRSVCFASLRFRVVKSTTCS